MIKISKLPLAQGEGDTVVFFVREKKGALAVPDREVSAYLKKARSLGDFKVIKAFRHTTISRRKKHLSLNPGWPLTT